MIIKDTEREKRKRDAPKYGVTFAKNKVKLLIKVKLCMQRKAWKPLQRRYDYKHKVKTEEHCDFKDPSESMKQRSFNFINNGKRVLYREARDTDLIDEDSTLRRTEKQEDMINKMRRYMN